MRRARWMDRKQRRSSSSPANEVRPEAWNRSTGSALTRAPRSAFLSLTGNGCLVAVFFIAGTMVIPHQKAIAVSAVIFPHEFLSYIEAPFDQRIHCRYSDQCKQSRTHHSADHSDCEWPIRVGSGA